MLRKDKRLSPKDTDMPEHCDQNSSCSFMNSWVRQTSTALREGEGEGEVEGEREFSAICGFRTSSSCWLLPRGKLLRRKTMQLSRSWNYRCTPLRELIDFCLVQAERK